METHASLPRIPVRRRGERSVVAHRHPPADLQPRYPSYNNKPSDSDQHSKLTDWTDKLSTFAEPSQHAISQIHSDRETLQERRNEGSDVGRLQWQAKGEFRSVSDNQSSRLNVDHNTGDNRFVRLRLEKIGWFTIRTNRDVPPADEIDEVILKKKRLVSSTFHSSPLSKRYPRNRHSVKLNRKTVYVLTLVSPATSTPEKTCPWMRLIYPMSTTVAPASSGNSIGKNTLQVIGRSNAER